jgi:hypothetical protein
MEKEKANLQTDLLKLGTVYCTETERHRLPLHGKLIAINGDLLTFERRDGRQVTVRMSTIIAIMPIYNQPKPAASGRSP